MSTIPFFFAGSEKLSSFAVDGKLIGWGKPNAKYFFQMWRDMPSHIIHFRNLTGTKFLNSFELKPIDIPKDGKFRYDFLAKGDVPDGFWIHFTAGIKENSPFISSILYKLYDPMINNLQTVKIQYEPIILSQEDFLILLTNLSSSIGIDNIIDIAEKNVLVGSDDEERRFFNSKYYHHYISYVKQSIVDDVTFLPRFLKLSGTHFLAFLIHDDEKLGDQLKNVIDNQLNEIPNYVLHSLLIESPEYFKTHYIQNLEVLEQEMKSFQNNNNEFFMNNFQ